MHQVMHESLPCYMLAKAWPGSDKIHSPHSNILATTRGRFFTFFVLYVSEGLAYGFTSVAMVAFMRTSVWVICRLNTYVCVCVCVS